MKLSQKINLIIVTIFTAVMCVGVLLSWQYSRMTQMKDIEHSIERQLQSYHDITPSMISSMLLGLNDAASMMLDDINDQFPSGSTTLIQSDDALREIGTSDCRSRSQGGRACIVEKPGEMILYYWLDYGNANFGVLKTSFNIPLSISPIFDGAYSYAATIAVLLSSVVLGLYLSLRRIVTKPIEKICNSLEPLKKGNFDIAIPEASTDELWYLSRCIRETIGQLRQYQEAALEQSQFVAIGHSTAMVAHDVRRPLAAMKALLSSLPAIKDDPAQVEKMIANVDRSIAQTNAMLNDILEFSRDATALDLSECEPQGIITAALGDALRHHQGADVQVTYDLKHERTACVDGARVVRVLTNIIDNALDAMTPPGSERAGGSLHIWTSAAEVDGKPAVEIAIADDGPGIPADVIDNIFDPFFTHGKKGGTGLGLAICRRIMTLHGGAIAARRREGAPGAEFLVGLPAGGRPAVINEAELIFDSNELRPFREEEKTRIDYGDTANTVEFMRLNKERGRPSTLLMVDDEPLFRASVRNLLAQLEQARDHVEMIEADSAEMALTLFEKTLFDYVIADIDLGKRRMNGYEFAGVVLGRHPEAHVIIHSNKRREEMDKGIRNISSPRFMGFLPKPMHASELLQFLACKTFEAPQREGDESMRKRQRCILLVNDDDAVRIGLKFQLKAAGDVQIIEASCVSDALSHLATSAVDIILSDVNLGNGEPDGYELLKEVKAKNSSGSFYMVSGYSKESEEPKALSLGADGYFQLPVEEEQFKAIL